MIPIRDDIRSRSFPVVNWLLILVNVFIFFFEISLSTGQLERLIQVFGLIPARTTFLQPITVISLFSHMFLHGGWAHIIGNMWILMIFGDNVEDRMGHGRYLVFYILCGLAAAALETFLNPDSLVPTIGASGAVAGVMGAYFILYPRAKVITFVPIFLFGWFVNIPALIYLGFWFGVQLLSGFTSLVAFSGMSGGGIAFWAHVGGFIFGLMTVKLFIREAKPAQWYDDEYYPW
jgi:membrane associated rhomboid family serine protease